MQEYAVLVSQMAASLGAVHLMAAHGFEADAAKALLENAQQLHKARG